MLLSRELQIPAHKHNPTAGQSRGLAVDSGDVVLALLEGEAVELVADALSSLDLLSLERQHGSLLVQIDERQAVGVEGGVVVLHKMLAQLIGVHRWRSVSLLRWGCCGGALVVMAILCAWNSRHGNQHAPTRDPRSGEIEREN